jgi:hypothetical protein
VAECNSGWLGWQLEGQLLDRFDKYELQDVVPLFAAGDVQHVVCSLLRRNLVHVVCGAG